MAQFYELFSPYINEADLQTIGFCEIVKFRVVRATRNLTLGLKSDTLLDYSFIQRVERQLKESLNMTAVKLEMHYSQSLFDIDKIEKIISPVKTLNSAANGFFDGVEAELEDDTLTLCLKKGGKDILEAQKVDKDIAELIYKEFGIDLVISFMEVQTFDIEQAVREAVAEKQK